MSPDDLWAYSQSNDLHWESWDNETVLYDNRSGDTHLVSNFCMALLNHLKQHATMNQTSLMAYMSDLLDELPIDQQAISIDHHLRILENMGFIKRKTS